MNFECTRVIIYFRVHSAKNNFCICLLLSCEKVANWCSVNLCLGIVLSELVLCTILKQSFIIFWQIWTSVCLIQEAFSYLYIDMWFVSFIYIYIYKYKVLLIKIWYSLINFTFFSIFLIYSVLMQPSNKFSYQYLCSLYKVSRIKTLLKCALISLLL